jgi:hypothetical protein
MAQVVEHPPSKYKALSSNSSITKNNNSDNGKKGSKGKVGTIGCRVFKKEIPGQAPGLMPVILAIQKAEIRRVAVLSQPW